MKIAKPVSITNKYVRKYRQTCHKGSPKETCKIWLLKTGDFQIQSHLHCILVQRIPKRWLLKAYDALTLLHSEQPKPAGFGCSECSRAVFGCSECNRVEGSEKGGCLRHIMP